MSLAYKSNSRHAVGLRTGLICKNQVFKSWSKRLICCLIVSVSLLAGPSAGWTVDGISAITMPSSDVTLSFVQPGRVTNIYVKEGDTVAAGQTLVQLDESAEQAQLLLFKEMSQDMTQIEAQRANLEQKTVYLERLQWVAERGSATEMELKDAKLEVRIAELALKTAEFEHEQNKRKYNEASIRVDNMTLKSPIAGRIEKIEVEVGESIDRLSPAVRVSKITPLWIDVHMPIDKGRALRADQSAQVLFPGDEKSPVNGKIIFISRVADAASSTIRTRIEVPNKSNRPAGELVSVTFMPRQ